MTFGSPLRRAALGLLGSAMILAVAGIASADSRRERTTPQPNGQTARWVSPPVDVAKLLADDVLHRERKDVPFRVGFPMKTNITPDNSGAWTDSPDGGRIWQLDVESKSALWLVVGFAWFDLQEGAELFVHDADGDITHGPLTSKDVRDHRQLWLPPIDGETVRIELRWPAELRDETPRLRLGTVSHGYRVWNGYRSEEPFANAKSGDNGPSGTCNVDVACQPEWHDPSRSVVRILSGGFAFCTGALINNTAHDCTPYVLTASHCNINPPSTTYQFNYECSLCEGGTVTSNHTLTGSTRVARYSSSDVDLLRLDDEIPEAFDAFFAGWNRSTNPALRSTAIHHPQGDVKKISQNHDALVGGSTGDGGWGGTHWRVTEWEEGTTEPSSSGSPMFDPDHRIVGQLHGGFASCTAITWDEYGKFDVSWTGGGAPSNRLQDWLDPLATGLMALDGIERAECLAPAPELEVATFDIDDQAGNGDGIADPGEAIALSVELANTGALSATGVVGLLTTDTPGATVTVPGSSWLDILSEQTEPSTSPFELWLDPDFVCGHPVELQLAVDYAEGSTSTGFLIDTGTLLGTGVAFEDDMESGDTGWSVGHLAGSNSWFQTNGRSNSPSTSWFVNDIPSLSDSVLVLGPLADLAPGSELTFWHYMKSEAQFDGGVLEYSTDGVSWTDAVALITEGPYNLVIDTGFSSPIGGRQAWSGSLNGWQRVTVDLESLAGTDLSLRWRFASDSFIGTDEGWYVDDVVLTQGSYDCAPVALAAPGEVSSPKSDVEPLRMGLTDDGVELRWSPPEGGGPVDSYVLYGRPLGHGKRIAVACFGTLGSKPSAVVADLPSHYGFLVVARNAAGEGSYGETSAGVQRTPAHSVCP